MFNSSAISLLPIIISPERWREAESLRDRDEIVMQRITVGYSGGQAANSGVQQGSLQSHRYCLILPLSLFTLNQHPLLFNPSPNVPIISQTRDITAGVPQGECPRPQPSSAAPSLTFPPQVRCSLMIAQRSAPFTTPQILKESMQKY